MFKQINLNMWQWYAYQKQFLNLKLTKGEISVVAGILSEFHTSNLLSTLSPFQTRSFAFIFNALRALLIAKAFLVY